jgi:aspartyl-tRNA(Asn)/glutamyl-tRNA(Gln) amidotransferase subunit A
VTADLTALSAVELSAACLAGDCTPLDAVDAVLDRITATGDPCRAFITVAADQARVAARALMERGGRGEEDLPLFGVPVTVKDLTATAGIRTTRGRLAGQDTVPADSAVAVERLQAAGAIVVGKTTTSDGGWKAEAGNLLVGPARNPWDLALTAGGSSGGAAVAVALGYGPLASGTDGAGSIRIPASFCGVVGYKPSFGLVPYFPVSAEGLSHFGPLARTVSDAALALDVLAGADERDPASWGVPWRQRGLSFTAAAADGGAHPRPLRVGVIEQVDGYPVDAEVKEAIGAAAGLLASLGHHVAAVAWRPGAYKCLSTILAAYAAADLRSRDPGVPVDPGLVRVAAWGATLRAADLAEASEARAAFTGHVRQSMADLDLDLVLMPTSPVLPFAAGADSPDAPAPAAGPAAAPENWLAWAAFCYPANLTGYPAISLPLCVSTGGLPIGVQLMGRWRQDTTVLAAARQLELADPWEARLNQLRGHQRQSQPRRAGRAHGQRDEPAGTGEGFNDI